MGAADVVHRLYGYKYHLLTLPRTCIFACHQLPYQNQPPSNINTYTVVDPHHHSRPHLDDPHHRTRPHQDDALGPLSAQPRFRSSISALMYFACKSMGHIKDIGSFSGPRKPCISSAPALFIVSRCMANDQQGDRLDRNTPPTHPLPNPPDTSLFETPRRPNHPVLLHNSQTTA